MIYIRLSIIDYLYIKDSSIKYLENIRIIYSYNKYIEINDEFYSRLKAIYRAYNDSEFYLKLKQLFLLEGIDCNNKNEIVLLQIGYLINFI